MEAFENILKDKINKDMTLEELVDTFCELCDEPLRDEEYLFETGIFEFTCDEEFYFSLVRQYDDSEDEYNQIHLDIIFPPSKANYNLSQSKWFYTPDEMKKYIKSSKEFVLLKNESIYKTEVWASET